MKYLIIFLPIVYLAIGLVAMSITLIVNGNATPETFITAPFYPLFWLWILLWPIYLYMYWIGGYVIG